ncbi:MAG: ATP-binding cassette domain-containing protein [Pseudomonadota bacterium]
MEDRASHPIVVRDLTTRIGNKTIHQGLNLRVRAGEILGLVGGSGSGKTLLLRTIIMLRAPTGGVIELFGKPTQSLSTTDTDHIRRRFAMMFQHGALFSSLSVLENIATPMREHLKLEAATIESLARLKLRFVGLPDDAAARYPGELSGGMLKRAAVARALALDPEVLILDEPTAGLDPVAAHELDQFIVELRVSLGITVIIVTHDLDSLWYMTDRVAFLAERQVMACLPIAELAQHSHPEIAQYFGGPRGRASIAAHR